MYLRILTLSIKIKMKFTLKTACSSCIFFTTTKQHYRDESNLPQHHLGMTLLGTSTYFRRLSSVLKVLKFPILLLFLIQGLINQIRLAKRDTYLRFSSTR